MEFNDDYVFIPQDVKDSFVQTDERVRLLGNIEMSQFEEYYRDQISTGEFNTEKAVQLGLKMKQPPLPKLNDVLRKTLPTNY